MAVQDKTQIRFPYTCKGKVLPGDPERTIIIEILDCAISKEGFIQLGEQGDVIITDLFSDVVTIVH